MKRQKCLAQRSVGSFAAQIADAVALRWKSATDLRFHLFSITCSDSTEYWCRSPHTVAILHIKSLTLNPRCGDVVISRYGGTPTAAKFALRGLQALSLVCWPPFNSTAHVSLGTSFASIPLIPIPLHFSMRFIPRDSNGDCSSTRPATPRNSKLFCTRLKLQIHLANARKKKKTLISIRNGHLFFCSFARYQLVSFSGGWISSPLSGTPSFPGSNFNGHDKAMPIEWETPSTSRFVKAITC
ncbi:hypothetical protein V8C35DRAFT_37544 [Trichoderma chlorosporum]